ncbi:hypothetical protein F5Y12DRAFT_794651 [Xylaria sp. FL1777]|nr:hypothetical protein F5Y12DRAFT_794651 [Xylaria sp. FL1777]
MISLPYRLLCGFAMLQASVIGSPLGTALVPSYFQQHGFTRRAVPLSTIQRELGSKLSSGSVIAVPSDARYATLTERWATLETPDIEVVVQPARESDIATIVKYCNANSIEFMAVNTGHGFTLTLGKFKGLQIDLKKLRGMTIAADGKSALLQGGAYFHDVVPTLWDNGYVTSTGASECVGIAGPALGGGHGRYEGLYGLVLDNVIHMNVVLANGSEVQVNSTSNTDLFWAMRGAGQNFGIVTSLRMNIYPKEIETWHYHNYVWSTDKFDKVLTELNKIQDNGKAPPKLGVSYGMLRLNSSISDTEPILFWTFGYAGPASEAEEILRPFNGIQAITDEQGDVPYPKIIYPQLTSQETDCGDGAFAITTTMVKTWNLTTERQNLELFKENIALYPEIAKSSSLFYEGYSVKAMQAVAPNSTAYPHRAENHLAVFQTTLLSPDSPLKAPAQAWAKAHWDIWQAGRPNDKPATYANYAIGLPYQTLESIYGYEPWRLEKLRALKATYDPENKFRYYNGIV